MTEIPNQMYKLQLILNRCNLTLQQFIAFIKCGKVQTNIPISCFEDMLAEINKFEDKLNG